MEKITDNLFKIEQKEFIKENIHKNGNRFLIGNGYLGYRGTLDEYGKDDLVAFTVPGLFDKQEGKWSEPVNLPNPLYTYVVFEQEKIDYHNFKIIKENLTLNLKNAEYLRNTVFSINDTSLNIKSKRFLSHDSYHLLGRTYEITSNKDLKIKLVTGLDLDIWDLNGPHLELLHLKLENNEINYLARTLESKTKISLNVKNNIKLKEIKIDHKNGQFIYELNLKKDIPFSFETLVSVDYQEKEENLKNYLTGLNYEETYQKHLKIMDNKWDKMDVKITGDELAQIGIRTSIYHLMIITPRNSDYSISARGVSGQVYKGACFWDTEMFMLPFYLLNDLETSKKIIEYRIKGLKGAYLKAKEFNYQGAFYAWESVKDGLDACTLFNITDAITNRPIRTYFKDKQIHISGDIVYGLDKYIKYTGDEEILINGGINILDSVSKFYFDYLHYSNHYKKYVVLDVIGPDEYHERVNNNAFTNKMVQFSFQKFIEYSNLVKEKYPDYYKTLDIKEDLENAEKALDNLISFNKKNNVIEQFEGYFDLEDIKLTDLLAKKLVPNEYLGGGNGLATTTKIIKQADVITMLYLFNEEFKIEDLKENYEYYFPRTEHGSSLSASMYALVACLMKEPNKAYQSFLDSALIDYYGKGKEYAGNTYIGGTHPASSGGAYMTLIYGFALMKIKNDKLEFTPNLPDEIEKMEFKLTYKKKEYQVVITHEKAEVKISE